jgi:hypothetical protein
MCCKPPAFLLRIYLSHAASTAILHRTKGAMLVQALGATAIATLVLYVADQLLWAGRCSDVVVDALKQVGLAVGIHA